MELFISILGCLAAMAAAVFSGIAVYKLISGNKPTIFIDANENMYVYNNNSTPIIIENVYARGCTLQEQTGLDEFGAQCVYEDVGNNKKVRNMLIEGNSNRCIFFKIKEYEGGGIKIETRRKNIFDSEKYDIEARKF